MHIYTRTFNEKLHPNLCIDMYVYICICMPIHEYSRKKNIPRRVAPKLCIDMYAYTCTYLHAYTHEHSPRMTSHSWTNEEGTAQGNQFLNLVESYQNLI